MEILPRDVAQQRFHMDLVELLDKHVPHSPQMPTMIANGHHLVTSPSMLPHGTIGGGKPKPKKRPKSTIGGNDPTNPDVRKPTSTKKRKADSVASPHYSDSSGGSPNTIGSDIPSPDNNMYMGNDNYSANMMGMGHPGLQDFANIPCSVPSKQTHPPTY